jgi:hypothetical protein
MQTLYQLQLFSLHAGWLGLAAGLVSGAIIGPFFLNENWLGGYTSHSHRLLRLGHVSFFGLALLNFAFAGTLFLVPFSARAAWTIGLCLAVGALSMPVCCLLCAWRKRLRLLFPIPVSSLLIAVGLILRNWPQS